MYNIWICQDWWNLYVHLCFKTDSGIMMMCYFSLAATAIGLNSVCFTYSWWCFYKQTLAPARHKYFITASITLLFVHVYLSNTGKCRPVIWVRYLCMYVYLSNKYTYMWWIHVHVTTSVSHRRIEWTSSSSPVSIYLLLSNKYSVTSLVLYVVGLCEA